MPIVAVVKGERSFDTVERAVNLAGGLKHLVDRPVLIKVNFITRKTWDTGATTDPMLVEALIRILKPLTKVAIVESDATLTNADKAFEATGMIDVCKEYDVPFINLRRERDRVSVGVSGYDALSEIEFPKIVMESNIISAAKLKTHAETQVTLGMKNMFGLIPDKFKGKYHFKGIEKVIVDINSVVKPAFTLIDGFVAMEGRGPVNGDPVKMDLVIAGMDPVATDAVAAKIMGFEPSKIYHIARANERGLGKIEDIEIVGEPIEKVKRIFRR